MAVCASWCMAFLMIDFIAKMWVKGLKISWSNFRFRKSLKEYEPLYPEIQNLQDVMKATKELNKNFHYEYDDITMLFDAMDTPPSCLYHLETDGLKDDCDGYHAAMYHLLHKRCDSASSIALITIVTKPFTESHTMCVFEMDSQLYLIDYSRVVEINSMEDVMSHMESVHGVNSRFYHIDKWNQETGKYMHNSTF